MQYYEEFYCQAVLIKIKEANTGNWKGLVKKRGMVRKGQNFCQLCHDITPSVEQCVSMPCLLKRDSMVFLIQEEKKKEVMRP